MRRVDTLLAAASAALLTITLAMIQIEPRFVWNVSESVPVGLYEIGSQALLDINDLVAVKVPEPLAAFLADRGYLPRGVLLLKRVAALPGQIVCRSDADIIVDGITVGKALERDRLGRPLPVWEGCQRIASNEVFLMNAGVHDSLDSRYFGPVAATTVIGRAVPLYTDDGDDRFVWRAPIWTAGAAMTRPATSPGRLP